MYYLHNPEAQLAEIDLPTLLGRLRAAFELLERAADEGRRSLLRDRHLGRIAGSARRHGAYLPLQEIVGVAREVAGASHRFRALQLPCSLALPEAWAKATRAARRTSAIEAAAELGLHVVASAALSQGRLAKVSALDSAELPSPALRALQAVRSRRGVGTALVGMSRAAHVEENGPLAAVALTVER